MNCSTLLTILHEECETVYGWFKKKRGKKYNIDLREYEGFFKHRINGIIYVPLHICLMQSFVKIYALV